MIRYVEHKDIDKKKWDNSIKNAHNSSVFGYSWYLDNVSENWDALVKGDYEAIMPIPCKIVKQYHIIYQPFFSRQTGIYSQSELDDDQLKEFITQLPNHFKLVQFGFDNNPSLFPDFEVKELAHQQLDLGKPYEEIFSGYSKNARRILKKANDSLKIVPLENPSVIVELFKSTKGKNIKALGDEDFKRLIVLMISSVEQNSGKALGVFGQNEELLAAGFFLYNNDTITYLKGASSESGRKEGAMYILFDHVIKENSGKGNQLDFGGSNISSIAEFYKKFGATDRFYLFLTRNQLPALVKLIKKGRDFLKNW